MSSSAKLAGDVKAASSSALEVVDKAKRESIGAKKTGLMKGPSVATPVAATAAVYAERAAAAERALIRLRTDVAMRLASATEKLGAEIAGTKKNKASGNLPQEGGGDVRAT